MGGSLSFLDVLGEDLVVLGFEFLGLLEVVDLGLLDEVLSPESLLSDESLDLGGLVEGLVTLLDFSSNNVLSNVVALSEGEDLSDVAGSLGAESAGLVVGGHAIDVGIALLDDLESDDSQIGAADAASHGLSLSLTSPSGSVSGGSYFKILLDFLLINRKREKRDSEKKHAKDQIGLAQMERHLLFLRRSLTLPLTKTPCFMGKPCLSLPPVILKI